jgi:hypothetical protein
MAFSILTNKGYFIAIVPLFSLGCALASVILLGSAFLPLSEIQRIQAKPVKNIMDEAQPRPNSGITKDKPQCLTKIAA